MTITVYKPVSELRPDYSLEAEHDYKVATKRLVIISQEFGNLDPGKNPKSVIELVDAARQALQVMVAIADYFESERCSHCGVKLVATDHECFFGHKREVK